MQDHFFFKLLSNNFFKLINQLTYIRHHTLELNLNSSFINKRNQESNF